jgi:hypothetical protein
MCLNETCIKGCIGKHMSDAFPIQTGPKQGMLYQHCFSTFLLEYAIRKIQEFKEGET